jgi:hypothetical protein
MGRHTCRNTVRLLSLVSVSSNNNRSHWVAARAAAGTQRPPLLLSSSPLGPHRRWFGTQRPPLLLSSSPLGPHRRWFPSPQRNRRRQGFPARGLRRKIHDRPLCRKTFRCPGRRLCCSRSHRSGRRSLARARRRDTTILRNSTAGPSLTVETALHPQRRRPRFPP